MHLPLGFVCYLLRHGSPPHQTPRSEGRLPPFRGPLTKESSVPTTTVATTTTRFLLQNRAGGSSSVRSLARRQRTIRSLEVSFSEVSTSKGGGPDYVTRAVRRLMGDFDRVDRQILKDAKLRRGERWTIWTALAAASVFALWPGHFMAHMSHYALPVCTATVACVGAVSEYLGGSNAATATEIAAVAVRAAAEAEEILSQAERTKAVLPVCVIYSASTAALSVLSSKIIEVIYETLGPELASGTGTTAGASSALLAAAATLNHHDVVSSGGHHGETTLSGSIASDQAAATPWWAHLDKSSVGADRHAGGGDAPTQLLSSAVLDAAPAGDHTHGMTWWTTALAPVASAAETSDAAPNAFLEAANEIVEAESASQALGISDQLRTAYLLVAPVASILAATVASLAQIEVSDKCVRAQSLGRRRFATKRDVGRTWKSVTQLVESSKRGLGSTWASFGGSLIPGPLAATLVGDVGVAFKAVVASAAAAAQAAYYLAVAEYSLARATESVSAKARTAAVAEAWKAQAVLANGRVPATSSVAILCLASTCLGVEVLPRAVCLLFPALAAYFVTLSSKFRAITRGSVDAASAAADQLAGLDDGSDDDPLLPLVLTWRNLVSALVATKNELELRRRANVLWLRRAVFGTTTAATAE